jgi:HSP20 family molecular chaperone IbpA
MALPVRIERGHGHLSDPLLDPGRFFDFGNVLGRFFGGGLMPDDRELSSLASLATLANYGVDIREDEDHVYIEADLPGFRKEDVDISIEDGVLTITAERREEVEEPAPGATGTDNRQQPAAAGLDVARGQGAAQAAAQAPAQAGQQPQEGRQEGRQMQPAQGRQIQARQPQGNYLLRERRVQRFVRSFTLPPNVDESNIQATLENGVLRITLNKRQESKARRVKVS